MASLKQKSIKGLSWDLLGSFSQQGTSFLISIFLARLLTPEQFGLVGMTLVVINVFQVFIDMGFASALIQNKDNSSLTYSSVFYLNILAGLLFTTLFFFGAPFIGRFYDDETITNLARLLSLSFIFSSFSIVQKTILTRQLDFKKLTLRAIFSQVISGVVGIVLALQGYGVYSLVIQNLLGIFLNTVILWKVSAWTPKLEFSFDEVKKLSGFSVFMFLDSLVTAFFQRLDVLFIGKVFSASTLGYYTRAQSLNNLVTKNSSKSITKVFFPVLSTLRDNPVQFEHVYFRVISLVCFISFGLTGVLYILGEHIILLLFGDQWVPSIAIFQILILTAFTYPINAMMVNSFLSLGKSKENLLIGFYRKSVQLIPLAVGYFYGLHFFLISYVCVSYLLTITNIYFLNRMVGVSFFKHISKIIEGAIPLVVAIVIFNLIDPQRLLASIGLGIFFVVAYALYNFLIGNQGFVYLLDNLKLIINRHNSDR